MAVRRTGPSRASSSSLDRYGVFSASGGEFIIRRPDTPRPWINYLTNAQYCAIISHCAGGYSFYKDCRVNRLTRWRPENYKVDRPGRYLYLREPSAPAARRVWSATYQPTQVAPEAFEARHGIGYTVIRSRTHAIDSEITYFVPPHDPCEVWRVTVTNRSARARTLELFPYVEWLLGDYHEELRYRNIMNLYNRVWFDEPSQAVFAKKTAMWGGAGIRPFAGVAFFGSSLPAQGAVTIKDAFTGRLQTEVRPAMLYDGPFRHVPLCSGEDGIACLRHRVRLAPKASVSFTVVMGQTDGGEPHAKALLARYRDGAAARAALEEVKRHWQARVVDNVLIDTPDADLNRFVNTWLKYEMTICNLWSRSPSYFHEGSGGRGYRDSCQDAEGLCAIDPPYARAKILTLAGLIRQDGTCAPGWSDIDGPAAYRPNKDHPTWLTSTVAAYIKETGDVEILRRRLPYLKDQWINGWDVDPAWTRGASTDGEGTLFEHLERNLNFTFQDVGPHGMPRIGHADWNDALDSVGLKGRGETVWLGMALVRSLRLLAELAERIGEPAKAELLRRRAKEMTRRINQVAWDGAWYLYGFTDDEHPFGSRLNGEGTIYLNTQAWAMLAGIAPPARAQQLFASVARYLDGPHGLALFAPAYTRWEPSLGRISMFSEGTKENAAVFCHAATFMIVAELMAGQGRRAHAHMRQIMPNVQLDYERYTTEPYVFAEYLVGPGNPYRYGEGAFSWITGTSGWFYLAVTEWLLGARRDYAGLRLDPCLPKAWRRCRIVRPFRGAVYDIEIRNPHGLEKGRVSVTVDGRAMEGNLISPHQDGKRHQVQVVLEPAAPRRRRGSSQAAPTAV